MHKKWSEVFWAPEGGEGGGAAAPQEPEPTALSAAGAVGAAGEAAGDGGAAPVAEGTGSDGGAAATPDAGKGESPPPFDPAQLKLPEGMSLPDEVRDKFVAALTGEGLTPQERGQALIDLFAAQSAEQAKAYGAAAGVAWLSLNKEWQGQVENLPEFKGKVQAELGSIKQALITLGAKDEFFAALDLTGAGNNPHILQILHKLTRPLVEGGAVGGGNAPKAPRSAAEVMYPTMKQE